MSDPGGSRQAAGSQAQAAIALQLFQRLVAAVEVLIVPTGLYAPRDWDTGDLDIAVEFPGLGTGTFVIKNGSPVNVTLPASEGPWLIIDGLGDASTQNITVLPSGTQTIRGAANFVMNTDWQSETFILNGTDFMVTP